MSIISKDTALYFHKNLHIIELYKLYISHKSALPFYLLDEIIKYLQMNCVYYISLLDKLIFIYSPSKMDALNTFIIQREYAIIIFAHLKAKLRYIYFDDKHYWLKSGSNIFDVEKSQFEEMCTNYRKVYNDTLYTSFIDIDAETYNFNIKYNNIIANILYDNCIEFDKI